jgi:hypothetical protein
MPDAVIFGTVKRQQHSFHESQKFDHPAAMSFSGSALKKTFLDHVSCFVSQTSLSYTANAGISCTIARKPTLHIL